MFRLKRYFIFLVFPFLCFANEKSKPNFKDFDKYQYVFTKEEISTKIATFLEKNPEIRNFYQITDDALYIGDLNSDNIDYILSFSREKKLKKQLKSSKRKSLKGVKIALDPGHFGGKYSILEERYINTAFYDTEFSSPIFFDEGTLTYLTAVRLKKYLEAEGAVVFCTRDKIGRGTIKKSFFEWLEERSTIWRSSQSLSQIFRKYYNIEDLIERANKINAFNPDITILIHYNASTQGEGYLTDSNYNMAFIPGAFCENELKKDRNRYDFLRLLLTDQIEKSLLLSKSLVKHFVKKLDVPLIDDNLENTSYIKKACLKQVDGVYSRNLALTRLIHSPLCYGETLVQNNKEEMKKLFQKDIKINKTPCSSRINQVARAYLDGIKEYFSKN